MNRTDDLISLGERIARDDQLAYRQLFILFYNKLSRFVMGFTKSKELTEEIVSDVFINVWRRRKNPGNNEPEIIPVCFSKNITFNPFKNFTRKTY
jgi:RNA polymerase sigma-70 factor (ECF subfamily)